jgi:hypothetical protein
MAAEAWRRLDIGFHGGQVLPLRVSQEAYDALRTTLSDDQAGRWYELETQDSTVSLDLSQVVYVRLDTEEHRVGF